MGAAGEGVIADLDVCRGTVVVDGSESVGGSDYGSRLSQKYGRVSRSGRSGVVPVAETGNNAPPSDELHNDNNNDSRTSLRRT